VRIHITLLPVFVALTFATSLSAQSLPDQAGPSLGHKSPTSDQESIANPGGFGKSINRKAIDPDHMNSNGKLACHEQQDLRDAQRTTAKSANKDCVR
jgi:hypothetical protein